MKEQDTERILFRLLYILKRLTDSWADTKFINILKGFKSAYIPVMMCIDEKGVSNKEIAKELHISKMASSKVVKELIKLELVTGKKDARDARSEILRLTKKGKELLSEVKRLSIKLTSEYEDIVGKDNYHQMIEALVSIRSYHESERFNKLEM